VSRQGSSSLRQPVTISRDRENIHRREIFRRVQCWLAKRRKQFGGNQRSNIMFLEAQKNCGLSRAQPCRKTPAIEKSQNFLTTADLFGREHRGVSNSPLALNLLEFLFVGDALHIHTLSEFAVSLEDFCRQTTLMFVDKFHQELLFLGVDLVDLRD
jgi:hypothetical protein